MCWKLSAIYGVRVAFDGVWLNGITRISAGLVVFALKHPR